MKKGFRGNCGFKGKLGMCPSLAEPYTMRFPKTQLHYFPLTNSSKVAILKSAVGADTHTKKRYGKIK